MKRCEWQIEAIASLNTILCELKNPKHNHPKSIPQSTRLYPKNFKQKNYKIIKITIRESNLVSRILRVRGDQNGDQFNLYTTSSSIKWTCINLALVILKRNRTQLPFPWFKRNQWETQDRVVTSRIGFYMLCSIEI